MSQKRFATISPTKFAALKDVLRSKGLIVPDGNKGKILIAKPKIEIEFTYSEDDGLALNLISVARTFGLPTDGMIWDQIQKGIDSL